jgi:hypothetical protein
VDDLLEFFQISEPDKAKALRENIQVFLRDARRNPARKARKKGAYF